MPLDSAQNDGRYSAAFWDAASALVDNLISEIQRNWSATGDATPPAVTLHSGDAQIARPASARTAVKTRVLIGAATGDLNEAVDGLREKLGESGTLDIVQLGSERVSQWDSAGDLSADLSEATVLVAPFSDAQPLNHKACAGGHLAIEQAEWARLGKPAQILWYRPQTSADTSTPKASAAHANSSMALSPVYASVERSKAAISGNGSHKAARHDLHREKSERQEDVEAARSPHRRIMGRAQSRRSGAQMDLDIRTRALDIDKLNRSQSVDDADGVILLFGEKHPQSLHAQINRVEDSIPIRGPVFPGFVALLMPPHKAGRRRLRRARLGLLQVQHRGAARRTGVRRQRHRRTLKDFLRSIRKEHKKKSELRV
jgi:hypothetical protein